MTLATLEQLDSGVAHPLGPRHVVGRAALCHLRLDDPEISGLHAELLWTPQAWQIQDLGSRNGTFVDGRRLAPGQQARLEHGAELAFADPQRRYRLIVHGRPDAATPAPPATREHGRARHLDELELRFFVSRDGEHIELQLVDEDGTREALEPRAHAALLLVLARARLADANGPALPASEHGWIYREDLERMLAVDLALANLWVHRARRQLADAGIEGAARLIERRAGASQLRIGSGRLLIVDA